MSGTTEYNSVYYVILLKPLIDYWFWEEGVVSLATAPLPVSLSPVAMSVWVARDICPSHFRFLLFLFLFLFPLFVLIRTRSNGTP